MKKSKPNSLQTPINWGAKPDSPIQGLLDTVKNKKTLKPKDILRLHSSLIKAFIDGSCKSEFAKTLSYLCSNQLKLYEFIQLESRLKTLEEKFL